MLDNPSDRPQSLQTVQSEHRPRDAGGAVANRLLAALPVDTRRVLMGGMKRVVLKRRQIIQQRNLPLTHAYFIERGAASLVARDGESATVEIRTLGSRDLVGIPIVLGTGRSPHRCVVQVDGTALQIQADALADAMHQLPELRRLLLSYVHAALAHSAQLAVCSTRHGIQQRLARWLLVAGDQLQSAEIALTHDTLSKALGVRRAGVTTAIGGLQQAGLVECGRGRIRIADRAGLERVCCSCYRAISTAHERVLSAAQPIAAHWGVPRVDSRTRRRDRQAREREALH